MTMPPKMLDEAIAEDTGNGRFQASIQAGGIAFLADEPVAAGGLGSGPTPYQLLAAALAACTTMTLRLYIERKGWPVTKVRTMVSHQREPGAAPVDLFRRRIAITGDMDETQIAHLLEIADRCPVHRTLTAGARVETLVSDAPPPADAATAHMVDMEALIAVGRGTWDAGG
jgi:putative redox protein